MEEVLKYFPTPDGEAVEIAREVKEEKLWTSRPTRPGYGAKCAKAARTT